MPDLLHAPAGIPLRIIEIIGGEGVRRRLFSLGFHKDDIIQIETKGIWRGPLLITNMTNHSAVALGRGVAQKIIVEVVHGKE
ncbi:MAG: FeoA domain-containing protein [Candidatus Aminicenantales bacterium]